MASSSQNNFDLNDVPNVQPEIRCSSFLSQKDPLMTSGSVMLDADIAASVAKGIITPLDEKLLADRTDDEAINESMALSIQCVLLLFQIWLDVCKFEGMKFKS
ncbi:hypothetical protein Acr_01g0006380 [Actinidia rufa]|uniref:Uncharacterized protein n=1 Tax=Actinidia rufa TaxID=165716 RepID=A0A7J0E4G0_9ERIC|nr:hypothetical protein Acr_01g0006380 [Actinidia rufa]